VLGASDITDLQTKENIMTWISALLSLQLVFVSTAHEATTLLSIDRFSRVSDGIFRGSRPERIGLETLSAVGIKTILNLDNDETANADEVTFAKELGLQYIATPMSAIWSPEDDQVNDILSILANPENYPIFVHCQHGKDRTGLIIGLYRVFYQKWTPENAYQEMLDNGFNSYLLGLDNYFHYRTEMND
jgi:protein tyrosine/serine phosphatase